MDFKFSLSQSGEAGYRGIGIWFELEGGPDMFFKMSTWPAPEFNRDLKI